MKKLQILGTGCPKCQKLAETAETAARSARIRGAVGCVMAFGVMMTPALAVDGEVKVSGKVPSIDELKKLLG